MAKQEAMSKQERVYRELRARIMRVELAPGSRLVIEALAREYKVSAVPVREAIRRLEAERLVSYKHNSGAFVAALNWEQWRDSMYALSVLAAHATALAVPFLRAEEIGDARAINGRYAEALKERDSLPESSELNREFHMALVRGCTNQVLVDLVTQVWDHIDAMRASILVYLPSRSLEAVTEHETILRLVERRAPTREVYAAAQRHMSRTRHEIMQHLLGAPDSEEGLLFPEAFGQLLPGSGR